MTINECIAEIDGKCVCVCLWGGGGGEGGVVAHHMFRQSGLIK